MELGLFNPLRKKHAIVYLDFMVLRTHTCKWKRSFVFACECVCVCVCARVSEWEGGKDDCNSGRPHRIAYIHTPEWVDLLVKVKFGRLVSKGAVLCVMGCVPVACTHVNISLGLSMCGAWFLCIDHHSSIPYAAFHSFGLAPGNKIGLCLE